MSIRNTARLQWWAGYWAADPTVGVMELSLIDIDRHTHTHTFTLHTYAYSYPQLCLCWEICCFSLSLLSVWILLLNTIRLAGLQMQGQECVKKCLKICLCACLLHSVSCSIYLSVQLAPRKKKSLLEEKFTRISTLITTQVGATKQSWLQEYRDHFRSSVRDVSLNFPVLLMKKHSQFLNLFKQNLHLKNYAIKPCSVLHKTAPGVNVKRI